MHINALALAASNGKEELREYATDPKTSQYRHRVLFQRYVIHARAIARHSNSARFLGRWFKDTAMRGLVYTLEDYARMRETGVSFWPESLLLTIIQIYVLDRETGVYLMKKDVGEEGSASANSRNSRNSASGGGGGGWMHRYVHYVGGGSVLGVLCFCMSIPIQPSKYRTQAWRIVEGFVQMPEYPSFS